MGGFLVDLEALADAAELLTLRALRFGATGQPGPAAQPSHLAAGVFVEAGRVSGVLHNLGGAPTEPQGP